MNELRPVLEDFLKSDIFIGERLIGTKPMLLIRVDTRESSYSRLYSLNEDPEESD